MHTVCCELIESTETDWRGAREPKHAVFRMTLMGLFEESSARCPLSLFGQC